jgi:hypothetical protein
MIVSIPFFCLAEAVVDLMPDAQPNPNAVNNRDRKEQRTRDQEAPFAFVKACDYVREPCRHRHKEDSDGYQQFEHNTPPSTPPTYRSAA